MTTIVRKFRYKDPNNGWGDAGTVKYYLLGKDFSSKKKMSDYFYSEIEPYDISYGLEIISLDRLRIDLFKYQRKLKEIEALISNITRLLSK